MNFKIRPATKEDCREISRMIAELAVYESMSDQVKISHQELERDGFCQNPFFHCLVAEVPEEQKSKEDMPIKCLTNEDDYASGPRRSAVSDGVHLSLFRVKTEGFTVVGYALYFYTYSTWKGRSVYLEDLYVMPEFRGNGLGNGLLSKVAEVGKKDQCVRLQLSVLDWNTPTRDFYAAKGVQDLTVSEGWHLLRFDGQHLDNLASEAPKD